MELFLRKGTNYGIKQTRALLRNSAPELSEIVGGVILEVTRPVPMHTGLLLVF